MESWFPDLDELGHTVRRIKDGAESISGMIQRGNELVDEAAVQLDRGRELLDTNQKLVARAPRTLG